MQQNLVWGGGKYVPIISAALSRVLGRENGRFKLFSEEVRMADHLDAPGLKSPGNDARLDITDIYAFQKPDGASKSILILNVNPLAPTLADSFRPDAIYELKIDTEQGPFKFFAGIAATLLLRPQWLSGWPQVHGR